MGNIKSCLLWFLIIILIMADYSDVYSQSDYELLRRTMVSEQIASRGINDADVINAMLKVPRHLFVPEEVRPYAYEDRPLSIGFNQTISQPYIVALMSLFSDLKPGMKVLEIGTGSGYQAAVLGELNVIVYSIEIIEELGIRAGKLLDSLGYKNITTKTDDGYMGWYEYAPYDRIIVTCSPTDIPLPLTDQLKEGGKMIIPIGEGSVQELVLFTKTKTGMTRTGITRVMFVPMVSPEGKRY